MSNAPDNGTDIDLSQEALDAAADKAIADFSAASTMEELTEARRQHLGDGAYIPRARQSLGSLPKDQRKGAGKAVNMARG